MPQPLRVVENQTIETPRGACWLCSESPEIAPFMLDREKDPRLGVSNQFHSGATHLAVDDVLKRTEREMNTKPIKRRPFWLTQFMYALMVFFLLGLTFSALFIIAEVMR